MLQVCKIEWYNTTQIALKERKKTFWFKSVNFIFTLWRCQFSRGQPLGLWSQMKLSKIGHFYLTIASVGSKGRIAISKYFSSVIWMRCYLASSIYGQQSPLLRADLESWDSQQSDATLESAPNFYFDFSINLTGCVIKKH